MILPVAHLGHWLWVFYVIPVLVVIAGIAWSSCTAKRRDSASDPAAEGSAQGGGAPPEGGAGRAPESGGEAPARRDPSR